MRKKDIISISYISVLTAIAVVYGFMSIPSPADQHTFAMDEKRVSNLGTIKQSIEDFYVTNKRLPETLDEIKTNSTDPSEPLPTTDPETKKPYEYEILYDVPPYIKLCATFTTDSKKDYPKGVDRDYSYHSYLGDYHHPKGYFCYKLNISYYGPTPTISETQSSPSATPYLPKRPFSEYPPAR